MRPSEIQEQRDWSLSIQPKSWLASLSGDKWDQVILEVPGEVFSLNFNFVSEYGSRLTFSQLNLRSGQFDRITGALSGRGGDVEFRMKCTPSKPLI